jgi:ABC-type sugar transport system, permease component
LSELGVKGIQKSVGGRVLFIVVILFSIAFLFPFYWMVTNSFKSVMVAITIPPEWFPLHPTISNYVSLFKQPALRWLLNSLIIATGVTVLVCLTSSMAGYSLAKKEFPGRNFIFGMFVAVMTLPKQVLLVPLFVMMRDLKLFDNFIGLIVPAVGWPFGIFLMKQFTQTMPSELLQAAKIDGCGELRTFWNIVIPMVTPGLGALAIFTFMSAWNDYFWQLIMIKSTIMKTIPLGVAGLQLEMGKNYGLIMAGSTLASLPMIVIFLAFQKFFAQGITLGAVKG